MAEDFEAVRRRYKPDRVNVLFIGESRPDSGKFFYRGDSNLYTATRTSFEQALHHAYKSPNNFLHHFQSLGCYLDDLCLEPVNQWRKNTKDWPKREQAREAGIIPLAHRIQADNPLAFVIVMQEIEEHVQTALKAANRFPAEYVWVLPFPRGERNIANYQKGLTRILVELSREHIIKEVS